MAGPQKDNLAWRIQDFIGELKRRKVFQVTSFYLVAAWVLSAGAADIFEVLGFPTLASRYFVIALFSLTPLVIVIAWVFELNRTGVQRDLGPHRPSSQTTLLADRKDIPALTATWQDTPHSFTSEFIVGRDDSCSLQIVDPLISRRHAKFEFTAGRWRVTDLGSANGTVVDGEKVQEAWLKDAMGVSFYPGGPELKLQIARAKGAETLLAPKNTS